MDINSLSYSNLKIEDYIRNFTDNIYNFRWSTKKPNSQIGELGIVSFLLHCFRKNEVIHPMSVHSQLYLYKVDRRQRLSFCCLD